MIEYMLANVICHEFEQEVHKDQYDSGKALHVGFNMSTSKTDDQYLVVHMYIFAPVNYVYVAIQSERIDKDGKRSIGPMQILSYHDSCWVSSVQEFICKNSNELNGFSSFALLKWNDIIDLTPEEIAYLSDAYQWRRGEIGNGGKDCPIVNPFDRRGIWAGREP